MTSPAQQGLPAIAQLLFPSMEKWLFVEEEPNDPPPCGHGCGKRVTPIWFMGKGWLVPSACCTCSGCRVQHVRPEDFEPGHLRRIRAARAYLVRELRRRQQAVAR